MSVQHDTATVNGPEDGVSSSGNRVTARLVRHRSRLGWLGVSVFSKNGIVLQLVCLLTLLMAPEAMAKSNDHQFQKRHRSVSLTLMVRGGGTVTSFPEGLSCSGGRCSAEFPRGHVVRLQSELGEGHFFHRWRWACRGSNGWQDRLHGPLKVMATFRMPQLLPLRVIVKGEGKVTSSPKGLECSNGVCFGKFPKHSVVMLTAIPGNDQTFKHWGGACEGAETCRVKLKRSRTVIAKFTTSPPPSASFGGNALNTKEGIQSRVHSCSGQWHKYQTARSNGCTVYSRHASTGVIPYA